MDEPQPSSEGIPAETAPPSVDPVVAEAQRLLGEIESELAAIERALDRLESGSYGTCDVCGAAITADELAADPVTARCAEHARSAGA
ncbi:MAG TPA: hypothetical protein VMU75_14595 [Acidimicrobiales bacterium]|nr:hypothetical protein [Acidimicrobiales bacterium]